MNPYTVTPVTLSLHAFALRQRQEPRRHAKRLYAQVSLIVVPMVMFAGPFGLSSIISSATSRGTRLQPHKEQVSSWPKRNVHAERTGFARAQYIADTSAGSAGTNTSSSTPTARSA